MFVILSMVVSLTYVTVMEQKMSQKTKSSVGAFYGAESGVEWALNKIANATDDTALINTLGLTFDSTTYAANCPFEGCKVYFLGSDGKVLNPSANTVSSIKAVRSVGTQGQETQRAIEAAVAVAGEEKYQVDCFTLGSCCRMDTTTGKTICYVWNGGGGRWLVSPSLAEVNNPSPGDILAAYGGSGDIGKYQFSSGGADRLCRTDTTTRQTICYIWNGGGGRWLVWPSLAEVNNPSPGDILTYP